MNTEFLNKSLAEIVNKDFRAAKVFDKYGLDFCCKGKQTLTDACDKKSLASSEVVADLVSTLNLTENNNPYASLTNDELINHIVSIHHQYIRDHAPLILKFLFKVSTKHGDRYPYMREVFALFNKLAGELEEHLNKEEQFLIPLIKSANDADRAKQQQLSALFTNLESEHDDAGSLMEQIRQISKNYEVPEQACNTFRVVLQLLEDFEADLHTHVFLENHILFPRVNIVYRP